MLTMYLVINQQEKGENNIIRQITNQNLQTANQQK